MSLNKIIQNNSINNLPKLSCKERNLIKSNEYCSGLNPNKIYDTLYNKNVMDSFDINQKNKIDVSKNYKSFDVKNVDECAKKCYNNSTCKKFSTDNYLNCNLYKHTKIQTGPNTGKLYIKDCDNNNCPLSKMFKESNNISSTTPYKNINAINKNICLKECKKDKKCKAVNFTNKYPTCLLSFDNSPTNPDKIYNTYTKNSNYNNKDELDRVKYYYYRYPKVGEENDIFCTNEHNKCIQVKKNPCGFKSYPNEQRKTKISIKPGKPSMHDDPNNYLKNVQKIVNGVRIKNCQKDNKHCIDNFNYPNELGLPTQYGLTRVVDNTMYQNYPKRNDSIRIDCPSNKYIFDGSSCVDKIDNLVCTPLFINNNNSNKCSYNNNKNIIKDYPKDTEFDNPDNCLDWCKKNDICKQVQVTKDNNGKTKCVYYKNKKCTDDNQSNCIEDNNSELYNMPDTLYNTDIPQQKQYFRPYYRGNTDDMINNFCSNGKEYTGFNCKDNLGKYMGSPYEPYYRHILNGGKMGETNQKSGTSYMGMVDTSFIENFSNQHSYNYLYIIIIFVILIIFIYFYKKN